jgi:cell wall-associated NlpC family hydrolase
MLLLVLFGGCASHSTVPVKEASQSTAESTRISNPASHMIGTQMADIALRMVGTPYRYGGSNSKGFDCSGLVFYSYDQLGMHVPRTSAEQRRAATRVDVARMEKGDLVFFKMLFKTGHVGIYVGNGRFVHAPSSGKQVSVSSLSTGYFASRLHSAGRLHD